MSTPPLSRTDIVAAARGLFSARGYAATSLNDIAAEIGVQKGAIYYHVPRKADLLAEIVYDLLRPIHAELERLRDLPEPVDLRLRMAIRCHMNGIIENREAARVFFEDRSGLPEDVEREVAALDHGLRSVFQSLITEGVERGVFRDVDPTVATLHLLAACNWPYRWFRPDGAIAQRDFVEATIDLLMYGLVPA